MSNVVQVRYSIATRGLRARYNPLVRVYLSASPRVYTLTRGLWAHNALLAIVYPIHICIQVKKKAFKINAKIEDVGLNED